MLTQEEVTSFLRKLAEDMQENKSDCDTTFKRYEYLKLYLMKERELYLSLNEMDFFNNFLQGKIYVRKEDLEKLLAVLAELESELKLPAGQIIQTTAEKYPTYYVVNDFTRSAQEIV